MMFLLLMAGLGAFLGGVVAILYGIPVKEFSFGNTLIVVGAMTACTGLIMIALAMVLGELKAIRRRIGARPTDISPREDLAAAFPDPNEEAVAFPRDPSIVVETSSAQEAPLAPAGRSAANALRARQNLKPEPEPAPAEPAPKARRNLIFASSSRKERERSQKRPEAPPPPLPLQPPPTDVNEPPSPSMDDSWLRQERMRPADPPPLRRTGRMTPTNAVAETAVPRDLDEKPVTVLKSGVVDGMAYSLYSDGSIEAQMPEGLMRFASIDELRSHLDQRPG
jgi:hypothetical protein